MKQWRKWKWTAAAALAVVLFGGAAVLPAAATSTTYTGSASAATTESTNTKPVAEVKIEGETNTVSYTDIEEALEAANGKTARIDLVGHVYGGPGSYTLTSGNITLDMNGYVWETTNLIVSGSGASLTVIGDGEMGSEDAIGPYLGAEDGAKLSIGSGTFAKLRLDSDGGKPKVTLSGGTFYQISSKGKNAVAVGDLLKEGYGYRRISTSATTRSNTSSADGEWITDEATLRKTSLADVRVDDTPIISVNIKSEPASDRTMQFSYAGDQTVKLTAEIEWSDTVSEDTKQNVTYTWSMSYNGNANFSEISGQNGESISLENNNDVGEYHYKVKVTYLEDNSAVESTADMGVSITPIEDGKVTNKTTDGYPLQYTYTSQQINDPSSGAFFNVDSFVPAGTNIKWEYIWKKNNGANGTPAISGRPVDAGNYILTVNASDAPNYYATGDFDVTIAPVEITARINPDTTTKVYDRTTAANQVRWDLTGVLEADQDISKINIKADSITYNTADAGDSKTITASGVALEGTQAGNYVLTGVPANNEITAAGKIIPARLTMSISHSPEKQRINKPVTVTVTISSADNPPLDVSWLDPADITLTSSGKNNTESSKRITLQRGTGAGVYVGQYVTDIIGDKLFEATSDNANFEIANGNFASDGTLTIMDKGESVTTLTASGESSITYGDSVTYTATVTKQNGDDQEPLSGTVQFYLDGTAESNKIDSAKDISSSGGTASVTLDKSKLTAGEHKIQAVFTDANEAYTDSNAEVSTTVAKKQLTWNVSKLTASKAAGSSEEATVYGELTVDGILDDEVKFTAPSGLKTSGFTATTAGEHEVSVVPESGSWTFEPSSPENYILPEGDPKIKAKVNETKELSNPPADGANGEKFKLVMEEGISTIPEGLKGTAFDTPEKVETELKNTLAKNTGYTTENMAIYDVTLQISTDDGKTWKTADASNFPTSGVKVTLPYPTGTAKNTHSFIAAHMFTTSDFGKTPGQIEQPAVTKSDAGLEFTVTGLSPIALAWNESNSSGGGAVTSRTGGVPTGDNSPITLYAGLAGASVVVIMTAVIVSVVRRKKKKAVRR